MKNFITIGILLMMVGSSCKKEAPDSDQTMIEGVSKSITLKDAEIYYYSTAKTSGGKPKLDLGARVSQDNPKERRNAS